MSIVFVTGGAGFIGSAVIRHALERRPDTHIVNIDKLTYAANLDNLKTVLPDERYQLAERDIADGEAMAALFETHRPDAVLHLAAESHVDRSIAGAAPFIETNIVGTYTLLEAARRYWERLIGDAREAFRFVHVSTDEVYGALDDEGRFDETSAYAPNSPYSASKASSDLLVRAWNKTFGLPVITTNCSNNYGPYQFPEKLIPVVILSAIAGQPIPVYGEGANVRDWLYVTDHADALWRTLDAGAPGALYAIGGDAERRNIDLVQAICGILDEERPARRSYAEQITFVTDRPGHDYRYAIDSSKIRAELGWRPSVAFEEGLRETVRWYLDNEWWWSAAQTRGPA